MTAGGTKSYKRRRTSSSVGPKAGTASAAIGGGAGRSGGGGAPSPPPPYDGLTAEDALAKIASDAEVMVPEQLYRLCGGLPRTELTQMCAEAAECERALREEIRILEVELERLGTQGAGQVPKKAGGGVDANKKDGGGEVKIEESGKEEGCTDKKKGGIEGQTVGTVAAATKKSSSTSTPVSAPTTAGSSLPEVKPAIGDSSHFSTANEILASDLTPPDRYFTVSALLGRLREPLDTPLPPNSALGPLRETQRAAQYRKGLKKGATDAEKREAERRYKERQIDRQRALLALESNPVYTRKTPDTAPLLACWKRISNHRSAAVFRKAVNPREAPGYTDRILFPIDLGLIRKMISAGHVDSFQSLHRRIGLICHNCVKYNGRESDYGLVTREFESYADDAVIDAVGKLTDAEAAVAAKAAASKAVADAAARTTGVVPVAVTIPVDGRAMLPPPPQQKVQRTASTLAAAATSSLVPVTSGVSKATSLASGTGVSASVATAPVGAAATPLPTKAATASAALSPRGGTSSIPASAAAAEAAKAVKAAGKNVAAVLKVVPAATKSTNTMTSSYSAAQAN
mmetsp:Transcript_48691/g.146739  ORF Transcript_48691/g.146739 Transcript_48691/m.146739 type:complete len:573 (-) Transcript_48691:622-2340(-)